MVVLGVAVLRHRTTGIASRGLWRPFTIGLVLGVWLAVFAVASLMAVQMIDYRSLPGFVETIALAVPLAVILASCFIAGWLAPKSARTWTPAAVLAGGACTGLGSLYLIYCSYEVYRNHGQSGAADIFSFMQLGALAPWVILFPVCLALAGLGIFLSRVRGAAGPGS